MSRAFSTGLAAMTMLDMRSLYVPSLQKNHVLKIRERVAAERLQVCTPSLRLEVRDGSIHTQLEESEAVLNLKSTLKTRIQETLPPTRPQLWCPWQTQVSILWPPISGLSVSHKNKPVFPNPDVAESRPSQSRAHEAQTHDIKVCPCVFCFSGQDDT